MLQFGELMARERATSTGCKLRDVWIDSRPAKNMKQIACSVITICWASGKSPVCFQRLTERILEPRFGRLRSYYANASMSAGDYFRSSLHCMQRELKKWQDNERPSQVLPLEEMTQNTFCSVASRAFQAALKLSAMCSQKSRKDLQAAFNIYRGNDGPADDDSGEESENEGRSLVLMVCHYGHV